MATANQVLSYFNWPLNEEDFTVFPADISHQGADKLMWAKNTKNASLVKKGILILTIEVFEGITPCPQVNYIVIGKQPRLAYLKVLNEFFQVDRKTELINDVARHRKNSTLLIGENVFVGENVILGDNTIIHDNCTILQNTIIGKNCFIKSFSSIGTEGLGFEKVNNEWIKFPQLGNVIIHDHCEIGPHATVRRSALGSTSIGKGTKIGSFCNIGHNCSLGENVLLTSNCILAGSSNIGDNTYLGVSSSIRNGISIGEGATVGMGAVVVKDVPAQMTVIGNPAKVR